MSASVTTHEHTVSNPRWTSGVASQRAAIVATAAVDDATPSDALGAGRGIIFGLVAAAGVWVMLGGLCWTIL